MRCIHDDLIVCLRNEGSLNIPVQTDDERGNLLLFREFLREKIKCRLEERQLGLDVAIELGLILLFGGSLFLDWRACHSCLEFHSVLLALFCLLDIFFRAWRLLLEVTCGLPLETTLALQSFLYEILLELAYFSLLTSPLDDGKVRYNLDLI